MELDTEKIQKYRKLNKWTWADVARIGKLKSRGAAAMKCKPKALKSADFFGKLFGIEAKDLLK